MAATILVPLDGSTLAEEALAPARTLAGPLQAELLLLRVAPHQGSRSEEGDSLDVAEDYLERQQAKLAEAGLRVQVRLERGDPADRILAVAEELSPRLVVMGTHGRSGLERLIRGSVAERVLRHVGAPLLLCPRASAPASHTRFARVLVPLDASPTSDQILPIVAEVAQAFGSQVSLLRVEPFLYSAVPSPALREDTLWDPSAALATIEPQRQRLAALGVNATTQAAYGVEAAEILAAAEQADLVAMTTHGRSGVSRWWFGSVAESVLRHCTCPLLVLRAPR